MSKRVKLPPDVKAGKTLKAGKGWRLITPKKAGTLKAALMTTYAVGRDRYAIFRINQ